MIEDQYEYIQQHNHAAQIANTIRLGSVQKTVSFP